VKKRQKQLKNYPRAFSLTWIKFDSNDITAQPRIHGHGSTFRGVGGQNFRGGGSGKKSLAPFLMHNIFPKK
jgi:hypothetical protein